MQPDVQQDAPPGGGDGAAGVRGMPEALRQIVAAARLFQTDDFFVCEDEFEPIVRYLSGCGDGCRMQLNRPQVSEAGFVHRVEWRGVAIRSVSRRSMFPG